MTIDGRSSEIGFSDESSDGLRALATEQREHADRLLRLATKIDAVVSYVTEEAHELERAAALRRQAGLERANDARARKQNPFGLRD